MFYRINIELEHLIRNSSVLKQKLSPKQLNTFLEATLSLPDEQQDEMQKFLEEERDELVEIRKQAVEKYEENIKKEVKKIKKEAEKNMRKEDEKSAEDLLHIL